MIISTQSRKFLPVTSTNSLYSINEHNILTMLTTHLAQYVRTTLPYRCRNPVGKIAEKAVCRNVFWVPN